MLPALSLDGMISCKIVEGSFDMDLSNSFIEGLLDQMQPFPLPNSVIVMDNCRIHKDLDLLDMVKERYIQHCFLRHSFI